MAIVGPIAHHAESPSGGHAMHGRPGIVAATLFGIVAVLVFIIQPGYVQGLVDYGHLNGVEAGYVASAEMVGYAATMILLSMLSHRLPWRPMLIAFIFLQAAGNAACLGHSDFEWLVAARSIAGLGAGGLSSLSFTAIGMTRDPDREFGFLIMWILAYGAGGLFALPSLFATIGLDGFYILVALATLGSLALVRYMPRTGEAHADISPDAVTLSWRGRLSAIASISIFFLGCGILWAYVSLIGDARGLATQPVANALGMSQFTGVAGALAAGLIGSRWGRAGPLSAAILICAVSTALIVNVGPRDALLFGAMVCLFNFAWNLAQPIYLAAATGFDRRGRLVAQMVAAQACGLALGPFVGATLGGERHATELLWLVSALFAVAAGIVLPSFIEAARLKGSSDDLPVPAQ